MSYPTFDMNKGMLKTYPLVIAIPLINPRSSIIAVPIPITLVPGNVEV